MRAGIGRKRRLVAPILLVATACSPIQAPERDAAAPLQTERLSYSFERTGELYSTPEIRVRIRNTTGAVAVLLTGLNGVVDFALDRLEAGSWVTRYRTTAPRPVTTVHRLQPGATLEVGTTIRGYLPGNCDDCQPILDLDDGTYRLRIDQGYVDSFDDELVQPGVEVAVEHRISNRFSLRAP